MKQRIDVVLLAVLLLGFFSNRGHAAVNDSRNKLPEAGSAGADPAYVERIVWMHCAALDAAARGRKGF
jgi:hypothetical protein